MYSAAVHAGTSKSRYLSAQAHFPKFEALKFHKIDFSIFKLFQLESTGEQRKTVPFVSPWKLIDRAWGAQKNRNVHFVQYPIELTSCSDQTLARAF